MSRIGNLTLVRGRAEHRCVEQSLSSQEGFACRSPRSSSRTRFPRNTRSSRFHRSRRGPEELADLALKIWPRDLIAESGSMTFLIADTFTDSLARLTGDEQKAVKTTAFDLQMDPVGPRSELSQAGQGEGQALLVGQGERGHPADRPPHRRQPAALLRRSPRPRVRVGGAPEARDSSHHRCGADDRASRVGPRDRGAGIRAG